MRPEVGWLPSESRHRLSPPSGFEYATHLACNNVSYPFALSSITDELGQTYATWVYDGNGRATSNYMGTSSLAANLTGFTYNSNGTVTVTRPLGIQDTYTFTPVQGVPKVSEIDRAADGAVAAASEYFTYDTNGYLNDSKDWNGNETQYTNNSHGLPTQIIQGYGSSVARTTTITYDTTWVHLSHIIVTPGLTSTLNYDSSIGTLLTEVDADTTSQTVPYSTHGQTRTTTYTYTSTGQLHTVQLPRTDLTAKTTTQAAR